MKNEGGLASIWEREKLVPVSAEKENRRQRPVLTKLERRADALPLTRMPVVNGPVRHPIETRRPNSSIGLSMAGLGKAIRGGPLRPKAPWWMCVAVFAGLE